MCDREGRRNISYAVAVEARGQVPNFVSTAAVLSSCPICLFSVFNLRPEVPVGLCRCLLLQRSVYWCACACLLVVLVCVYVCMIRTRRAPRCERILCDESPFLAARNRSAYNPHQSVPRTYRFACSLSPSLSLSPSPMSPSYAYAGRTYRFRSSRILARMLSSSIAQSLGVGR